MVVRWLKRGWKSTDATTKVLMIRTCFLAMSIATATQSLAVEIDAAETRMKERVQSSTHDIEVFDGFFRSVYGSFQDGLGGSVLHLGEALYGYIIDCPCLRYTHS